MYPVAGKDVVKSQFYEANCYIRGTNLVAKYSFFNGTKSEYPYSTLPDNIYGTYSNGRGHATVKPGIYSIEIGGDHCNSRAYNVKTVTGGYFVPCQRWDGNNWYDDTADGILIHRAEGGPTDNPWSTGCITIEAYLGQHRTKPA